MRLSIKNSVFLISLLSSFMVNGQNTINGKVFDKKGDPIIGANIYILGSIEGASSNIEGDFNFKTSKKGILTLVVSSLGFKEYTITEEVSRLVNLHITLQEKEIAINEVVISASNFKLGQNRTFKKMNALDVVLTGSSNGDIYSAIQSLPGTQKVGEDGRLYIRGGESRETQTFIDGMHVLMPYTTTTSNMSSRGRFSPFLFKGINFSLGGYDSEYGQALSSVLPMETKDVAPNDKIGISFSPFNIGAGGTNSWKKSSLSFSGDFMNMSLYNRIFPDKYIWSKPYEKASVESQYKIEITPRSTLKLYVGYDYTSFTRRMTDLLNGSPTRDLKLRENNSFINSTYRALLKNNVSIFLGAAYSNVDKTIKSAEIANDNYSVAQNEVHLKGSVKKIFSDIYKLNLGTESYLKGYQNKYINSQQATLQDYRADYKLWASYLENQVRIVKGLYSNISARLEYTDFNQQWSLSPRFSTSYITDRFQLSGIYGLYHQASEDDFIAVNGGSLKQESATHYILSASYDFNGRILKSEVYYKDYNHLALLENNLYESNGHGFSQGIDLYFLDETTIKNLKYSFIYSYNDSKRLYKDYPVLAQPQFSTKHNLTVSMRYFIPKIKTYFSISDRFASGRPYTDPNKGGFLNLRTTPYNSLDLNLTFLVSKDVIVYTSLTNVLNRKNVFQYSFANTPDENNVYRGEPVTASRDRFFYIGIFISLKNDTAYDISSF